jgi:hypothetical protein
LLVRPGLDRLPLLIEFDVALITDLQALFGCGLGSLSFEFSGMLPFPGP